MGTTPPARGRNRRGQGDRLGEEIVSAALRMLDDLGDDEALSLRAVAREIGIAATSVYLHFADRDALVLAAMRRSHDDLVRAAAEAGDAAAGPVAALRARVLVMGAWAREHPGLYKVLHESTVNRRHDTAFKLELGKSTAEAVQRCMDAGLAPADDAATVALDLRAAVHGAVSMRVNEPGVPWEPLEDQIDRLLAKIVGVKAA